MSLEYNDIKIDGRIRISPSSFYLLFDNPAKWYKQTVDKIRDGVNTNLVFGSIIHNRIEQLFNNLPVDVIAEEAYINSFNDIVEVNAWEVYEMIEPTWNVLSEHLKTVEIPVGFEEELTYIPTTNNDIFIGGTYDYRYNNVVGDYKTTSTSQSGIKTHHKLQLLLYAYMLNKQGHNITEIEVTYIVKPKQLKTKFKDAVVQVYREPIDEKDMQYVLTHVKNLGTKISMCKANPELVDLFFYNNPLAHF